MSHSKTSVLKKLFQKGMATCFHDWHTGMRLHTGILAYRDTGTRLDTGIPGYRHTGSLSRAPLSAPPLTLLPSVLTRLARA